MRHARLLFLVFVNCTHHETARAEPEIVAAPIPEPVTPKLAALTGEWIEHRGDGWFIPPLGATEARPLVVAIHGAGDRPEWACAEWRGITDAYAVITCPHGDAFGAGYAWSSVEQLEERARSAELDARARYGAYVDPGPPILVGFSQGARLASIIARKHPDRWPVVAIVEGGYDETKWGFGAAFAKGGKRVLFACSTWHCAEGFRDGERSSIAAKVDVRVADLGNLGHHMGASVRDGLRTQFRWLVRDDERWESWLESP
jgi:pimeloyl-ACP methyl ester carboxylesterase